MSFPALIGRGAHTARLLAWGVLAFLFLQVSISMLFQVDGDLNAASRVTGIVVHTVATAAFIVVQQGAVAGTGRGRAWPRWTVVLLAPIGLFAAQEWATLALAFATMFLDFPRRTAWVLALAETALTVLAMVVFDANTEATWGIPVFSWLLAGVLVVLVRLTVELTDLQVAREQIARMVADEERQRISRELHDIIGRTMVAMSVRTQAALQLVDRDPDRCRAQLEAIATVAQDGQEHLRSLVRGDRIVGVQSEVSAATDLFTTLGIQCDVVTEVEVPAHAQTMLAKVLREAVTNMLKHSRPRAVTITISRIGDQVSLCAVNDGVRTRRPAGGTGLSTLATALAGLGGSLTSTVRDGRFVVDARVPVVPIEELHDVHA